MKIHIILNRRFIVIFAYLPVMAKMRGYSSLRISLVIALFSGSLLPASAHPGIGIVRTGTGIIFYTDLQHVWRIENGKKWIAVRGVHTHELYLDRSDNLYGEHLRYDGDAQGTFTHFLWRLTPMGKFDTLISPRRAYVNTDFSLARDHPGTEFYIKLSDSTAIYRRISGRETVFARGSFKRVKWLHPQRDGSLLFTRSSDLYRSDPAGNTVRIANDLCAPGGTLWGSWTDRSRKFYAAVLSEGVVKEVDGNGRTRTFYTSRKGWKPLHGVFDDANNLFLMECNSENVIRVIRVINRG